MAACLIQWNVGIQFLDLSDKFIIFDRYYLMGDKCIGLINKTFRKSASHIGFFVFS